MSDDQQSRPPERDFYEETLEEHRECMEVVSDLETFLGRQPDREGVWVGELVDKLEHLGATLRGHFEEEHDGLYVQLPIKFPRLSTRLTKLRAEHATILESLDGTLEKARRSQKPELYELRELNAHVQLLVATIRRHEAEENEIVIEAHWDEVGVGD